MQLLEFINVILQGQYGILALVNGAVLLTILKNFVNYPAKVVKKESPVSVVALIVTGTTFL